MHSDVGCTRRRHHRAPLSRWLVSFYCHLQLYGSIFLYIVYDLIPLPSELRLGFHNSRAAFPPKSRVPLLKNVASYFGNSLQVSSGALIAVVPFADCQNNFMDHRNSIWEWLQVVTIGYIKKTAFFLFCFPRLPFGLLYHELLPGSAGGISWIYELVVLVKMVISLEYSSMGNTGFCTLLARA